KGPGRRGAYCIEIPGAILATAGARKIRSRPQISRPRGTRNRAWFTCSRARPRCRVQAASFLAPSRSAAARRRARGAPKRTLRCLGRWRRARSRHREAAVHADRLTGDVRARVGREEHDRGGEVLRRAEPAGRYLVAERLHLALVERE